MFNATLLNTRNAHSQALGLFAQSHRSRDITVGYAADEDRARSVENAYMLNADYRNESLGWSRGVDGQGMRFFTQHMIDFPETGGAVKVWSEATRENLKFDDKLARTPRLSLIDEPLTPDSIVAGELTEDKALAGRRKLRELIESKVAAERNVALLVGQLREAQGYDVRELESTDRKTWHLFVGAAESAERREYCSEYDSIAGDGEIPTREQLRDAGMLSRGKGTVRVTFNFSVYIDTPNVDDPTEEDSWSDEVDSAARHYITHELDGNDYEWEVSD